MEREREKSFHFFCLASFVARLKRHKKGTLMRGEMPQKGREKRAEDGEKTLALAKQSHLFSSAQYSVQLSICRQAGAGWEGKKNQLKTI